MSQSSTADYLASLRAPLGRTVDRAKRAVERELNTASQMGRYGNTIQRAVDKFSREFEAGILFGITRLKRARRQTNLDHAELWQATVQELENFKRQMISAMDVEGVAALRLSQMSLVHSELSKLDERLALALRQFQQSMLNDDEVPCSGGEIAKSAGNPNIPPIEVSGTRTESDPAKRGSSELPDSPA